ncbi:hypothetical protein [Gracilibacillus sp. YIM 98692]|uniref:hypothetical protein n=1 Tax=Gracilibacillus sp. YIM 98692 TaxID=2663532 RepID=UPI001969C64D|nr:hypothetical protein [Gracilibacillus sp. YIM 98692]
MVRKRRLKPIQRKLKKEKRSCEVGPLSSQVRRIKNMKIRERSVLNQHRFSYSVNHPCNGDEDIYENKIGSFSKALPHYPAGHSCVAEAAVTMLKAFFDESYVIPNLVDASSDGTSLQPYEGALLKVGGELDKLAANIAFGRDTAGVHWRSDGMEGLKLGEKVSIEILKEYKGTYNEDFNGFSLTKFDGEEINI